ncbi:calcium-transporting ATPase 2, plasma membrane-type-like [Bidens hawaiensis]|uniref:calcium-transporting ATPase 2, plasma membrane-type-like n=1 Tax=Bidens hawaiensis TaxID=980011 RepID=UPI00404904E8
MENYLNENTDGEKSKVLRKWRDMCGHVNNPKGRFRVTANAHNGHEADQTMHDQKLRVAVLVSKVAFHFLNGAEASSHKVPKEFKASGYGINANDASSIVESHNPESLKLHGGVEGLAAKLKTCTTNGFDTEDKELTHRRQLFGTNEFMKQQSFQAFVSEALEDMTIMILVVCAIVLLPVGITTEWWATVGIMASLLLVVFVTATSNHRNKGKKKIFIQVTRNGNIQKLSMYELLPDDIIHLDIGDQVPADGLFVSGFAVSIDKSSLTGEREPVKVNTENPYMFCGTRVQDGSCKMLVVAVGMRTQWGKRMET